ncbi:aspartyl-tRNA(Asn)/glutamyl-tRNA(Gln) amidotransferase subunit A [Streptomyces thermodiastaticus]|uniref:Aspartyl-tRNA(Asn)/glutamyl-tRNA(Gln) amidotransferase subunit A n=1 Tax=Streptomyces thermodiastaticus TaxID=44061 RepID=A0ABU0KG69_9ACTN|nr:aspartyl-tRNA(Asn)/glutamyl-tRNA(Gln) amidotransferase subunit A [Streptomyces thermodiastaticus]UVT09926.1 amidase [Streptomyces thermocarboxydus]WSB41613.1 amidase [Streptomyces cellulosae]WTF20616.1 amidase [Streptomyces cellulosae]
MSELTELTATRLVDGYRKGEFGPVEVTRAALRRAEEIQPEVNAFVRLLAEEALERAAASEARWRRGEQLGPLDGVPVTVKDILLLRGAPTLKGSRTVDPAGRWDEDAPSVARLRERGAVFLGKTTTPEFGWKGVTDSPLSGITRNPHDPSRTAGGSSGGAAAAVALGAGPLALGTDGGGSVRIPAAFCGIFALKPTYGRVPLYPASAFGTLAHVGPMTRTAADAALLLDAIAAPDSRDWSALPPGPGSFPEALGGGVRGLRVAFSPSLGGQVRVDPGVAAVVRRAVERLAGLGAYVEETDPDLADPVEAFHTLWFAGAARVTQALGREQRERLDPGLREIVREGSRLSALDYLAAVDVRMDLGRRMGRFHDTYDLLVTPTLPVTAFEAGAEVPRGSGHRRWTGWTPFTYPFNMTQQPAASVPVGLADGLPVGLQLVAARHRDDLVLRAAHALDEAGVTLSGS